MIHFVDQAIEAFLRDAVPLPNATVDISFATPDKTWGAGLSRPTVNCFLWDVGRDLDSAAAGVQRRRQAGEVQTRLPDIRLDLRYVITTWATEERDEHQLLGNVLQAVVAHTTLPEEHLPTGLEDGGPVSLTVSGGDERKASEFWSALGGQLKPGINLQVGVTVRGGAWEPTAPPPRTVEVRGANAGGGRSPESGSPEADPTSGAVTTTRSRRHGAVVAEVEQER